MEGKRSISEIAAAVCIAIMFILFLSCCKTIEKTGVVFTKEIASGSWQLQKDSKTEQLKITDLIVTFDDFILTITGKVNGVNFIAIKNFVPAASIFIMRILGTGV